MKRDSRLARFLSILLTAVLVVSLNVPVLAFADDEPAGANDLTPVATPSPDGENGKAESDASSQEGLSEAAEGGEIVAPTEVDTASASVTTYEEFVNAINGGETDITIDADVVVADKLTVPEGVEVTVSAGKTLRVLSTLTNNGVIKGEGTVSVSVVVKDGKTANGVIEGNALEADGVTYEISLDGGETWIVDTTNGKAQAATVKTDGTVTISPSFQSAFTSAKTDETVHMLTDAHVQSTNPKKNNGPLRSYYGLILEGNGHTIFTDLESSGASNEYATIKFTSYLAGTGPEVSPVLRNVTIDSQKNAKADLDLVSGDVTFTVTLENVTLLGNCQYASFAMKSPALIINKSNVEIYDSAIPSWDAGSAKAINIYSGDYALGMNTKCTLYGGTYNKDVSAYVAEGYVSEKIADSKWRVQKPVHYIAQVGETKYESLKEAIEACTNGETVILIDNVIYDADDVENAIGGATGFGNYPNPAIVHIGGTEGTPNLPSKVNAVLDLNGYSITNNADAYLFLIMDNAQLVIKDTGNGDGIIGNTEAPIVWTCGTDTLVTIDSGKYTTVNPNGLMHATHSGDLVINGGEFSTTAGDASLLIVRNSKDRQNSEYFISGKSTVTVKGGVFHGFNPEKMLDDSTNPYTEFNAVADGYAAVEDPQNVYTVVEFDYIKWIKEQLLAGNDVTLERDIVVDGSYIESIPAPTNGNGKYPNYGIFNVVGDYDVKFDLNGHTITYNGHKSFEWNGKTYNSCTVAHGLFYANAGADLTIVDSSKEQTGNVMVYGLASGAYVASPGTTITIEGGTWKNVGCAESECGGTNIFLYPLQGGELYIKGGYFEQALDSEGESYLMVVHGGEYANSVIDYSKTKIEVSGGTFVGMDPEKAKYFQQTADNKLVQGAIINVVAKGYHSFVKEDGVWGIEKCQHVAENVQTGVHYNDAKVAVDAAESGQTVRLIANASSELILLDSGITFDLNGKTLDAGYFVSFEGSDVIDSSEKKAGVLDVDEKTMAISAGNSQLPVRDASVNGYRFATVGLVNDINARWTEGEDGTLNLRFRPSMGEVIASIIGQGAEEAGVDIVVTLSWSDAGNEGVVATRDFIYSDELVTRAYLENKVFTLDVMGLADLGKVDFEISVVSGGVTVSGEKYSYPAAG